MPPREATERRERRSELLLEVMAREEIEFKEVEGVLLSCRGKEEEI